MDLLLFSKELYSNTIDEMGDRAAKMGFDGIDLTVRPHLAWRSHVLPEEAKEKMPQAIDTLNSKGLTVPMISTSITDLSQPYARDTIETAHECGVKYVKLGYLNYLKYPSIYESIESARSSLEQIYDLCREYNITAGLHFHSINPEVYEVAASLRGTNPLYARAGILLMLLKGFSPRWLCVFFDPAHSVVQGSAHIKEGFRLTDWMSLNSWKLDVDLLGRYIKMLQLKDYEWYLATDEKTGEKLWKTRNTGLSDGFTPWPDVVDCLKKLNFDGPVSFNSNLFRLSHEDHVEQIRKDLEYFKGLIK